MEKSYLNSSNKGLIFLSIIAFLVGFYPEVNLIYRVYLFIASIIILGFIYVSIYFKAVNKLESKIEEIENKIERIEDLISIKNDIKLLKRKVLGYE